MVVSPPTVDSNSLIEYFTTQEVEQWGSFESCCFYTWGCKKIIYLYWRVYICIYIEVLINVVPPMTGKVIPKVSNVRLVHSGFSVRENCSVTEFSNIQLFRLLFSNFLEFFDNSNLTYKFSITLKIFD